MGVVVRIGEHKEDNSIITPKQLLEMVREDIDKGDELDGLLVVGYRTKEDGTDILYSYRCRMDADKEQTILANRLLLVQLRRLQLVD